MVDKVETKRRTKALVRADKQEAAAAKKEEKKKTQKLLKLKSSVILKTSSRRKIKAHLLMKMKSLDLLLQTY